jgi:acetyl-CoA hydrolase
MPLPFPILTADEAAALITHGSTLGVSGFTAAGSLKAIPLALAQRAREEQAQGRPFQVGILSGASTGPSVDGALAAAGAISFRAPYQSDPTLRAQINDGRVRFVDMHLSTLPQQVRYGFLGEVDWAIVEAADVTPGGGLVLTASVGASNTFLRQAKRILIEWNTRFPASLLGLHDLFEPLDPPGRNEIPIFHPADRIGSPLCLVDPRKIAGVVMTDADDECGVFAPVTPVTDGIGGNIAEFIASEVRAGRIPPGFLPLQSGVGDIANSVLAALGRHPEIPAFEMYTEVLQDSVIPLLESGRVRFASTCALTLSPERMRGVLNSLEDFRHRLLLRPQEISNHPEVVRRLGIISLNTAIEIDVFGNVNSTHVLGRNMMNGIGGSGDFTRNAYLSIFSCPSTQKDGRISTIVPMASHQDHNEHSVQIVATEQGVADLRGKGPLERAELIIERCAHPDYREPLRAYLNRAPGGHIPASLDVAFDFHQRFAIHGDMRIN